MCCSSRKCKYWINREYRRDVLAFLWVKQEVEGVGGEDPELFSSTTK